MAAFYRILGFGFGFDFGFGFNFDRDFDVDRDGGFDLDGAIAFRGLAGLPFTGSASPNRDIRS